MVKKTGSWISLLLFAATALMTIYSFAFPFEAGDRLQGVWFALIIIGSPVGLALGWGPAALAKSLVSRMAVAAVIGHFLLLLFLFLYMTLGYVIFGV